MLQQLKNHVIDRQKWDACINHSLNKLIYANSWFLDIVSPGWEAVVYADYIAVMPLPVKSKFGFKYIVQPLIAKQSGIFSTVQIDQALINSFFEFMITRFSYIRLNLNSSCVISNNQYKVQQKQIHELNLDSSYIELRKNYKRRTFQNLNRVKKGDISCNNKISFDDFLSFARLNTGYINKKDFTIYINLLEKLMNKAGEFLKVEVYGAFNSSGKMVSTALFFDDEQRKYFIFNVSDQEGINSQSMYMITDSFIKNHADKKSVLDFTGSDINGIAYFIESFGAEPVIYQYMEYKNLPFPMNLIFR